MQFYFGNEIWDKKRILESYNFAHAYQAQTLQFCRAWLEGNTAFTLQTSGSTGKPKNIQIQRKQMQKSAEATAQKLGLRAKQTALITLNTNYIAGKMMLVRCLEIGMDAHIIEPSANPLADFTSERFDFTAFVPMQLQSILEQSSEKVILLNQMKAIIVGGAPVSQELIQKIQQISAPIYATYGMTETVSHIALKRLNGNEKQTYYETLPNVQIGQDERNCLTISAPMTLDKELITNDIVHMIADNKFEWLGRFDNVINSGGVKVQAEKVERIVAQILLEMNLNIRPIVVGISDEKLGEKVILCLESEALSIENQESIKKELQNRLNRYEVPKTLKFFQHFPTTPTGKIARQKMIQVLS